MDSPIELNFRYLQSELARIDLLIRRQVFRWQIAGQDPNDSFRGLYVSDSEATALLNRSLASNWAEFAGPQPEGEKEFDQALEAAAQESRKFVQSAKAQGLTLRLVHLQSILELDPLELDTFLICAAPSLDLRYERLYGYLQDDVTRKRPTINLILDLLCPPGEERMASLMHFNAQSPLFRRRLLETGSENNSGLLPNQPALSQPLNVDESVVSWLLGEYHPRSDLNAYVSLRPAETASAGTNHFLAAGLDQETCAYLVEMAAQDPVVVFHGADLTSQDTAARLLSSQAGKPLLDIWLPVPDAEGRTYGEERLSAEEVLRLALRDALLNGAIPFVRNWEAVLSPDGVPAAAVLKEICQFPRLAIISGRPGWRAGGMDRPRSLVWLEFPIPAYPQRRDLWQHHMSQSGLPVSEPVDLEGLAGQFLLTAGQIRDAVAYARDRVSQYNVPFGNEQLFAAARLYSNPRLSSLARKINSRYSWGDIVLPADQISLLHEIVNTVRQRPRVLDEWGVGIKLASSRGVTVLFAGPPGTGKTMAAEVMARELGLDLYKIDLSTVVSKYIGETEKNLERIFNEAEASNAILFFDEADALFGKRSEVRDSHDRYANIEISYLLQRMEAYDGVTMLATNLRANLDEAFTRRLQFAVDFPFPEEADRLRIWKTLFPPDVPLDPQVNFSLLARRFRLAGGNIRNIIVSAAYLAASNGEKVTMAHLLHGTRRELQKLGRLVGEGDMLEE